MFELTKPRVLALVMVTMACGAFIAPGPPAPWTLVLAFLGTALVVGSANALNMYLERDTDALMTRTRRRPLPSGRMQPEIALWFGVGIGLAGLGVLIIGVSWLCAALTLLALLSYVLAYTPLKRVTPLALQVGAIPGAIPPLIGWASVTGSISFQGFTLFLILFVWQLPHFLAISVFRQAEYERAKMQVLPAVRGLRATKRAIAGYSILLVLVTLLPLFLNMAGWVYGLVAGAAGVAFVAYAFRGLRPSAREVWSRALFLASMPYLVVVFGALVASAS
jgi:protoheme IX farnesyltransferase